MSTESSRNVAAGLPYHSPEFTVHGSMDSLTKATAESDNDSDSTEGYGS